MLYIVHYIVVFIARIYMHTIYKYTVARVVVLDNGEGRLIYLPGSIMIIYPAGPGRSGLII